MDSTTADALCDRIEASEHGPVPLHAFVAESETAAARRSRLRAEERAVRSHAHPGSPLRCVPVAVKDVVRVDGLPTTAGSLLPAEVFAGPQATAVDRLRAAGALIAGKTVTAEFAMSAPGPTRNPRHRDHTPGGSSSGSAAAVAAGIVPLALGTQTVGSVIRPAAYCGVVGFRPTHGRIPCDGVVPNAPSLDTLGVLADSLQAVEAAAAVLCDGWSAPDTVLAPPVLGVPDGRYLRQADPDGLAAFEAQVRALVAAGFTVRRVPMFEDLDELARRLRAVNRHEAARSHAEWYPRYGHLYRPQSGATVREGHTVTEDEYARGLRWQQSLRSRLADTTHAAGVDLWITPAAPGAAPSGLDSTGSPVMCAPWSYTGWPALSLPAGRDPRGLPFGLQCVAPAHADERLLAWAAPIATALAEHVTPGPPRTAAGRAPSPRP
ncbi:amidase [Kitasatospora sp. NPDC096147]|uniref:amidase n=1 Tax=Kitasatospora sp. NPDC096147 TaxID=3364093 RepID=UPI003806EAF0